MKLIDRIGIVGGGVVGRATARTFLEHAGEVRVYDTVPERATATLADTLACDLIFVCLPTPPNADGDRAESCNTGYLDFFFREIARNTNDNYVIRSTVPVGYTRYMAKTYNIPNLCHSPEFLTARCSITDAQIPARNIIGAPSRDQGWLGNGFTTLQRLYDLRFPGVQTITMSSDESESVKLILNSFFAVKVAFFNEAYSFAKAKGLDWQRIIDGVLSDGRIAHSHTQVPGPDGKRGYGGACLPKDLMNFINCVEASGEHATVCHAANARNVMDRDAK